MLRDLAESDEYQRCCEQIEPDAPRLDELLRYPLYAIAEKPEAFPLIPKTNVRRAKTNGFPGAPSLIIYFRQSEDDCKCELLWMEPSGDEDLADQLIDGEEKAA